MSNLEAYTRIVERLVEEVWNNRNLDAVGEVFHENATMHHGGVEGRGGHIMQGIPAFREGYMRPSLEAFPDLHHTIEDVIVEGDKAVVRFYGDGTHENDYGEFKASHKVMRYEGIAIFRIESGKIAEVWVHSNAAKQLAALAEES
jgi:predicted ester cyclase